MLSAKKTILLVEDEAIIAMAERVQLEAEGYAVITAASGEASVDAVCSGGKTIDLVLMDIDLGHGIDGTEAARRILDRMDVPILFLSSHIEKELVAKTESITNYGYVVKDSSFTVLDSSIKMAFKLFDAKREIESQRARMERAYEETQAANDELLRVQRDLADSEETFRSLFSNSPMGIAFSKIVYGPAGEALDFRFVDVNESFVRLVGIDPRGRLATESFPGLEDVEFDWIGVCGRVAATGESLCTQQRFWSSGRWFDVVAFRSKPGHFAVAFTDITDRKAAEEELERERAHLRSVIEGANVGTWTLDARTGECWVDERAMSFLGYSGGELDVCSLDAAMSIKHPDDAERSRALLMEHIAGASGHYECESRMRRKDGSWAWIFARGKIVEWNESGYPRRLFGVYLDVTERKAAELALRESEERFRSFFDMPMVGIAVSTVDMRWIMVNPGFSRMLGYSQEELLGHTWVDFTHHDDVGKNAEFCSKVLAGEIDGFSMEKRYKRKDGSYLWAELSLGSVRNPDGTLKYVVLISRDIDRFKRA